MRPAPTTASLRTGSCLSAPSSARRHRRRHSRPVEALEDRRLLSVTNGSFEFGMVGWTIELPLDGFADAVTTHTSQPSGAVVYGPTHGEQFALLKTNGPGSYTTATQSVTVAAGDKVSGWAFFDTNDYSPFADNAQVYVREVDDSGAPGAVLATAFDESVQTVGDRAESPWKYWEYTFSSAGTYAIQARVTNTGDSAADSFIGLER